MARISVQPMENWEGVYFYRYLSHGAKNMWGGTTTEMRYFTLDENGRAIPYNPPVQYDYYRQSFIGYSGLPVSIENPF